VALVLARATGGSTTRNTGEMRPMGTGKRRISLVERLAARVAGSRVLGLELAPVAAELEHVPVEVARRLGPAAAQLELGRVEVALELDPVAAELALVQVEAVPVPNHPRAQLAVAPRTKSVTAAHHPDLVPLLAAGEDLAAAVAETTREPAATEAVIAWAAEE
jgi:hypothetical protein